MASLEARILQLEVAIAPPEVEDLQSLRRRQAAALDRWHERTAAQAEELGLDVEEYRAKLLDRQDRREAERQGLDVEEYRRQKGWPVEDHYGRLRHREERRLFLR